MRKQSNPTGTRGSVDWVIIVRFCCACAENAPKPSSARKTPARKTNNAIRTRRLKNPASPGLRRAGADCEIEYFFILEIHWSERFLIETFEQSIVFILCPGRNSC